MNITTNNVEVSTPFFHENNTAAMNTHETLVGTAEPVATAEPVEPKATAATAEPMQWCPCKAASEQSHESGPVQSAAEENTFAYAMQASLSHATYNKQYADECSFQVGVRTPECKALLDKIAREYEKMANSRLIVMQSVRLITPLEERMRGSLAEDTNPVPWRWENRTAVPVEERGACLYRPVTYPKVHSTPSCLLRENDVVDNGTVMCIRAFGNECFYGNETMKAILEFDRLYRPENTGMFSSTTWLILIVLFFVGALTRKAN